MIPLGTLVNTGAVLVGGLLGTLILPAVPERVRRTVMKGLGLGTLFLGLRMVWPTNEILLLLISLAAGAALGEVLHIEERLTRTAQAVERLVGEQRGDFARALVRVTLLFCVGAMAITGALEDGLGNPSILYAKAILDGTVSIMFASTMGLGVLFAAVPVLVYQGAIALAATWLKVVLTQPMIDAVSASGGLLIVAIGLNLTEAGELPVGNLLPAIPIMVILVALRPWLPWLP